MKDDAIKEIFVKPQDFAAYEVFDPIMYSCVRDISRRLKGLRIVHVNSTEKGGGVAELLQSQVALENGLGMQSRWLVLQPKDAAFFQVTKKMHNMLQGAPGELSASELALYNQESDRFALSITANLNRLGADVLLVHDPQPYGACSTLHTKAKKLFRLHVDASHVNPSMAGWLCRDMYYFSQVIVSHEQYAMTCMQSRKLAVIAPAIDPFIVKNSVLPEEQVLNIMERHGISLRQPMISQVSRFDMWKDQLGVVEAFRNAKKEIKDLQLVLVGFFQADDDPEAYDYFQKVNAAAQGDTSILLFFELSQLHNVTNEQFISALQSASDVVLQKSIREGFGLTATEAMWKGKPVIVGSAGGLKLQVQSNINGIVVETIDETATAITELLSDPIKRKRLGDAARETVMHRYLMSRYIYEHAEVYERAIQQGL